MPDFSYKEARDRSLEALLVAPTVRPAFGVDWSYADAIEVAHTYHAWQREQAVLALQQFASRMAVVVTEAAQAIGEFLTPVIEGVMIALNQLAEAFRPIAEAMGWRPATDDADVVTIPSPPWRSSPRLDVTQRHMISVRPAMRRSVLTHRARDAC